jgi:hypothetical protein
MESYPYEINYEENNIEAIKVPTSPNNKNLKRKKLREEELDKKLDELQKSPNKDVLDTDILHECLTPPSELEEENNYTPRRGKSNFLKIIHYFKL